MRVFNRLLLTWFGFTILLIGGLGGLALLKFNSFLSESITERLEIVTTTSAQDFTAAVDLGLKISEVANGGAILERAAVHDPNIQSIEVFDTEGNVVHATGTSTDDAVNAETFQGFRLASAGITAETWGSEEESTLSSGVIIDGPFGQPVGGLVVDYSSTEMQDQSSLMTKELAIDGLEVILLMGLLIAVVLGVRRSMTKSVDDSEEGVATENGVSRSLMAWFSIVMIVGVVIYGLLILDDFNRLLEPELERRADLVGETISHDIERATSFGIPLTDLVGVEEYFGLFLEQFPELDHLVVREAGGDVLYASGQEPASLTTATDQLTDVRRETETAYVYGYALEDEAATGSVDVGVDRLFVPSKLQDLALDIGVILIVALVVAFELMTTVSERVVGTRTDSEVKASARKTPLRGITDIRLVLFLFVVGEELNKSFLPLFIEVAENPIPGLDPNVAISLPILSYLLTLAVVAPFAGRLVEGFGQRGLFLMGLIPAALSHLGMIFTDNLLEIMGLRALTGIGYALATLACQEYILARLTKGSRARTIGVFVGVIIGGTFAGTALGGIFADRLGYQAVFAISFVLVIVSGMFAIGMMNSRGIAASNQSDRFSKTELVAVLRNPSVMLLLGGVTIPMNVLMAAFLWYLVPLTLAGVGSNASAIARTLMIYYLVILLGSPFAGRVADKEVGRWALVGAGSVVSGAILLLPALAPSALTVALAVLVVGVGHTIVRGPQVALALDIADAQSMPGGRGAVLAAMRSLERVGSLIGLLVVSLLAARYDLNVAIGAVGAAAATASLIFLFARRFAPPRSANA